MCLLLFSIFIANSLAYQFPPGKQGLSDPFNSLDATTFNARYRVFAKLQSGLKNYNVFWSDFESSGTPSSPVPYTSCPDNYVQVPSNRRQRVLDGFHSSSSIETRGCIPNNVSLDDFEDYISILAERYNGLNGYGHIC